MLSSYSNDYKSLVMMIEFETT